MTARILVADTQRHARVDGRRLRRLAAWLLARAADLAPQRRIAELSIALVDDDGIAPVNEAFLGHRGATDVISFTYARTPTAGRSAELIVNVQRAVEEARRRRIEPARELALYLAHGCQHLAGRDDGTPARRAAMRRVEERWLRAAAREGLVRGLFRRFRIRAPTARASRPGRPFDESRRNRPPLPRQRPEHRREHSSRSLSTRPRR